MSTLSQVRKRKFCPTHWAHARRRRLYSEFSHWRKYQPFLPERLRITAGNEPSEEFWSWRSAEIHLDRYAAPASPLTVIVLHGGGGCGRLLAPFGRMLQLHGYEAVLPDMPGYGLTVSSAKLFRYDVWVDCAAELIATIHRRTDKPVVVMGMSVGGYLAYLAAAKSRLAAGVIATTLADPRLPIVRDQFARAPWVNRLLTPLMPAASAVCGGLRMPIRWVSNMQGIANHPELSRLLCVDELGGGNWASLRFMSSLLSVRPAVEPEEFDLCPVLLAQPAADRWTTLEASLPFFQRIAGPKQLVMLENCGHFPIEEPGVSRLEQVMLELLRTLH